MFYIQGDAVVIHETRKASFSGFACASQRGVTSTWHCAQNGVFLKGQSNRTDMFAVLPTSLPQDDAEWYTDLDHAYDVAYDWSVDLSGERVNIYEVRGMNFIKLTEVFA